MMVSDYVKRGLQNGEYQALAEALLAAPDDARAHARLGMRCLDENTELGPMGKPRADHETLMATRLDPFSAEVWQARATVLKALERVPEVSEAMARGSALAPR